jgi:hypothetical protein
MWRELLQLYAVQAREFPDAVARLGQHEHVEIGRDALTLREEIKRRQAVCTAVGDDLDRFIEQRTDAPGQNCTRSRPAPPVLTPA